MSILGGLLEILPRWLVQGALRKIGFFPPARKLLSSYVIDINTDAAPARPHPYSMQVDGYTSWETLTDRRFTTRHLPPSSEEFRSKLPDPEIVVDLMMRNKAQQRLAHDTSLLFPFFAQWFTDSFLRTHPSRFRENQSNHGIDLCQIYGMTAEHTHALREHEGGRLKRQFIGGAGATPEEERDAAGCSEDEYGAFLFEKAPEGAERRKEGEEENWVMNGAIMKEEFRGLYTSENFQRAFETRYPPNCTPELEEEIKAAHHQHLMRCFAVGLEHGNSTMGNVLMNTLFLREHNRLAGLLEAKYGKSEKNPEGWDDDRIFETARNINIVGVLKLVVQEYVPHIAQFDFPLQVVPGVAETKSWYRTNWIAVEFNILYRWHGLIPDSFQIDSKELASNKMLSANELFLKTGVDQIVLDATRQRAGRIGLGHTPDFLRQVKERTVELARNAKLRSYNDYREHFHLKRHTRMEQLTKDPKTLEMLETHYKSIDDVEYLVGLLAESYKSDRMMGELQERMVAHDAFTHALTNPLLAKRVFTKETFSELGMQEIEATNTLGDIVARNTKRLDRGDVSFSYKPHYTAPMPLIDGDLEVEAPGEAASIQKCLDAVAEAMRVEYPTGAKPVRRDAHPKHHGIVRAKLTVDGDLPKELQHGIFAKPKAEYDCWVRFSNGSPKPQPDAKKDARGMAIKVLGVEGERAVDDPLLQNDVQDFVMIDNPVFFIKNPGQYAPFVNLQTRGKQAKFFFSWNPCRWHIRQGLIARSLQKATASPLENSYFSMSPYKLGPHAVKFSLRYSGERKAKVPSKPADDFLREEMSRHLSDKAASFDFMVQRRTHPSKMPIEDPTVLWCEKKSPFRRVARLEIPAQTFDEPEQMKFAEDISYNPWNSLMAHAPLGGINRVRFAVYKAVSKLRHARNQTPDAREPGSRG